MINSQFTLKQIEAFVCVVDMGSFRKAAAVLGTTQPNISNRISTLEASLDVILMERDAGSIRLTDRGRELLAAARKVLWGVEAFLEAAGRQDLVADRMRLGITELIACTWLHPFLRRFREAYPSVAVELEVGLSADIDKKLASGDLDLALQTGPFAFVVNAARPLGTYPYIWVAAPAHARGFQGLTPIAELLRAPVLIHAKHTLAARALAKLAERRKIPTHQMVYSNSLASCVQMAVDGMGVALLPMALVAGQLESGSLQAVGTDWHPDPLEFFARFDSGKAPRFIEAAARFAQQTAMAWDDQNN